jgi:hypothetical protein
MLIVIYIMYGWKLQPVVVKCPQIIFHQVTTCGFNSFPITTPFISKWQARNELLLTVETSLSRSHFQSSLSRKPQGYSPCNSVGQQNWCFVLPT